MTPSCPSRFGVWTRAIPLRVRSTLRAAIACCLLFVSPSVWAEPDEDAPTGIPQTTSEADGLYIEFGRGVNVTSDDGNFRLTIRGRLQARSTWARDAETREDDIFFQARRARLVFLGTMRDQNLQLYLQLGLGASDVESDRQVPLRDAVITWTPFRSAGVRLGQMKVPFSRERIISSSALQLADRSIVNAEFNLDRDVGVQVFSNDVFSLGGMLSYQLGIYGGDGRNRAATGTGLLYAGRLQYQPFGEFEDSLVEADLTRARRLRLSFGVAGGYNQDARRARSTHGAFYTDETFTFRHASADVLLKYAGFSLQSEAIYRDAVRTTPTAERDEAAPAVPRAGWGYMVQAGYLAANGIEGSMRWAEVKDLDRQRSDLIPVRRATLGLGQYVRNHDLKIQADYGLIFVDGTDRPGHEGRVQVQVFF
jgi:phosphate-selective porin OprO/OprP